MIEDIALAWLLGATIGSMLFFAITVAPAVFRVLPADQGGAFLRRFFPRYYLWGIALATLCVVAAWSSADRMALGACVLVAALFVYARQVLMPRINRARDRELDGDGDAGKDFRRLHLQSVVINGLQLLLLLGASLSPLWA